jgi:hypothetical protein
MNLIIQEFDHDVEFAGFLLRKYVNVTPVDGEAFDMRIDDYETTHPMGLVAILGHRVDMDDPDVTPLAPVAIQLIDIERLEI